MRKGYLKNIFIQCLVIFLLCLSMGQEAYAAEFQGTVSSATAVTGEQVTVTVTFSSSVNIGAYVMKLTYDASVLEYVSGADGGSGGTLQFYNDYLNAKSKSYTITFTAKNAGTSNLSLEVINTPFDMDMNDMSLSLGKGSVTVTAPVTYSSENRLASMNVYMVYSDGRTELAGISPAFSADTLEYQLSIPSDVERLSVDAAAQDSKAAVAVSGTRMDPGSNSTTIKVTAENGDVRAYKIYTEKAQEETTVSPEEDTTLPTDSNGEVKVDNVSYTVTNLPEELEIPEGYEQSEGYYNGQSYTVLRGLSTKLVLMYLVDGNGQGKLFIYDEKSDAFLAYSPVTIRQHVYTLFEIPADIALPYGGVIGEDYQEKEITINDKKVTALHYGVEGMYLVYAMNWEGEYSLYYYDANEETMLRYVKSAFEDGEAGTTVVQSGVSGEERELFETRILKRNLVILAGVVLVIILIGVIVIMATALRQQKQAERPEFTDEESEDAAALETSEDASVPEDEIEEAPMDEEMLDEALDDILSKKI